MKFNNRYRTDRYINGNYIVKTSSYGNAFFGISKRVLRIGEEFNSRFPDSIDLKITNRCSHGCPFCHESSTKDGELLNLDKTKEILSQLPEIPIEIAVGGGNVFECLYETTDLLSWLAERSYRTRITINLEDLMSTGNLNLDNKISELLVNQVEGLGVSVISLSKINLEDLFKDPSSKTSLLSYTDIGKLIKYCFDGPQVVYHVIAGITPVKDIKILVENMKSSVLVLGYKQWGRARDNSLPDMTELKDYLRNVIQSSFTNSSNIPSIGFDNLAIEQLGVKEMIKDEDKWKEIYLGDEGSCSMYIDAVKGEFARTSRSPERVSWDSIKLLDYYASLSN